MAEPKLDYIVCVAQTQSILKASEKLYITPSALSKYVRKREEELGVQLFDRVGKQFILTYAGERYLEWRSRILTLEQSMQMELQAIATQKSGRIRIGVQLTGSDFLVSNIFPAFQEKYPHTKLELYEDTSGNIKKMLDESKLDYAILPWQRTDMNLKTIPLAHSNVVLVLPKSRCDLREKAVNKEGFPYPWMDLKNVREELFIAPFEDQEAYQFFSQIKREYDFNPHIIMQTRYINTILNCVKNGLGLTITTDQTVHINKDGANVELCCFGDGASAQDLVLLYHKNHFLDTASKFLISLCQSYFERLTPFPPASQE